MSILSEPEWRHRQRVHQQRVLPWVDAHRGRRARAEAHPVIDFLFTYYSFRPGQLQRWSPGIGVSLEDPGNDFAGDVRFAREGDSAVLDPTRLTERLRNTAAWVARLLAATASRPGLFGCFGLHEWAMVYQLEDDEIRHSSYPLRLSPQEVAAAVEAQPVCCTHYDAFRFFTPPAAPLNALRPSKDNRVEMEQPGCLHTNMDLYKWAYKLAPWVASELIADCFELAARIRELDMRASPYDLAELGYPPVRIETPQGRAEYEDRQRAFAAEAEPLRQKLLLAAEAIGAAVG